MTLDTTLACLHLNIVYLGSEKGKGENYYSPAFKGNNQGWISALRCKTLRKAQRRERKVSPLKNAAAKTD